jgi:Tfp pilus assembly protein PilX
MTRVPLHRRAAGEQGVALVIALMAMTLMIALGMALMMTTITETKIAAT